MTTLIVKEEYKSFQTRVYYNVVVLSYSLEKGKRAKNLSLVSALIKVHGYKSKITGKSAYDVTAFNNAHKNLS